MKKSQYLSINNNNKIPFLKEFIFIIKIKFNI